MTKIVAIVAIVTCCCTIGGRPAVAQTGSEDLALAQGIISPGFKITDAAHWATGQSWHHFVACQFGSDNGPHIVLYNNVIQDYLNLQDQENYWFFRGDDLSWSGTVCHNVRWNLGDGSSDRAYLLSQFGPITAIYPVDDPPQCTWR